MRTISLIPTVKTIAGSKLGLLARLRHPETGSLIVEADISTADLSVTDTSDQTNTTRSLAVASVVHDVVEPWDLDDDGYNVEVLMTASEVSSPGNTYVAALVLTMNDSSVVRQVWKITTESEA